MKTDHSTELRTINRSPEFSITWQLTSCSTVYYKAVTSYTLFSVAINWQLNGASLTYVIFINLAHYYGKRPCKPCVWSTRDFARSQTNDSGIWPGNETCAHTYNNRKWRPSQWTAATECCEGLLSTRVKLTLWRHWVVGKLRAVMSIRFVLKSRWALEPFLSYHCLNKSCQGRKKIRKMALLLSHTFAFSCLPRGFWPLTSMSLVDHKGTQRGSLDA